MRKVSSIILQIVIFALAVFTIFFFSYLLGNNYLQGDSLQGNDAFSFYVVVDWLGKFYPKVPFWFPLEGGGISFTGYQWFSAYIINTISYFTDLSLVQSFRLLGFLSIPLTAVGIFVYCWTRLTEVKSIILRQVIGFIASIFMVTAPVSYVFLTRWGFYAETISIMFIPWILIFLDLFLERLFDAKFDKYYRLSIFGFSFFAVLGFMTHFYVIMTTIVLFSTLFLVKFFFLKENKITLLKRIFFPTFIFVVVICGAFIFRYYSYSQYTKQVAYGGLRGAANVENDREGTKESILTPKMMLSLDDVSSEKLLKPRDLIVDMRFPFYVWILLIPTLIFGLFKSKKIFIFAVLSVIGFIVNTNIDAYIFFSKIPFIGTAFLGRLFFVTGRFVIPIAASFGAFVVWEVLFSKLRYKSFLIFILGLSTVGFLIFKYYNLPYSKEFINIGVFGKVKLSLKDIWNASPRPDAVYTSTFLADEQTVLDQNPIYSKTVDLIHLKYKCAFDGPGITTKKIYPSGHICSYYPQPDPASVSIFSPPIAELIKTQKKCNLLSLEEKVLENSYCRAFYQTSVWDQLQWKNWPKVKISGSIDGELLGAKDFFNGLPENEYRYDVSGFSARTLMSLPLVSNNSMIQVYINNLSLIYNLWNYQSQMMYSNFPLYQKPNVLTEIAKWYGIKYVYLAGTPLEPLEYWKTDPNWTKITGKENDGWREFQNKTELVSWDTRPKMLVIADDSRNFYDETFKFLTRGGLKYEDAIPVQGGKFIDVYNSKYLSSYEVIFMRAYGYKNKNKAYKLLDEYVKNGGKLIFDTGWQYFVPDFQIEKAPSFMPFDSLTWRNLEKDARLNIKDSDLSGKIDSSKLGDLTFGDASWGVSSPVNIRPWAKVLAAAADAPLIVTGEYGKGKVTWIGFNIIPHSETKDSEEEIKLFNNLLMNLIREMDNKSYKVEKSRPNPDRVEFILNDSVNKQSNLFFRESYYPDWNAKLVSNGKETKLDVNRAGPGFMLIELPKVKAGDKVIIEIKNSFGQLFANFISIATFTGLIIYLFKPSIFEKLLAKIPKPKINTPKFSMSSKNEDEDY